MFGSRAPHAALVSGAGVGPRASSGRNPCEIRCQNADCAAVLDVSAVPVEYETILRQLFRRDSDVDELSLDALGDGPISGGSGPAAAGDGAFSVAATSSETAADGGVDGAGGGASGNTPRSGGKLVRAASSNTNLGGSGGDGSGLPWEALRDAAKRGDNVTFAALVSSCASPSAGVDLPYCDACTEGLLRAKSKEHTEAAAERDRVLALRDDVVARVAAMAESAAARQAAAAAPGATADAALADGLTRIRLVADDGAAPPSALASTALSARSRSSRHLALAAESEEALTAIAAAHTAAAAEAARALAAEEAALREEIAGLRARLAAADAEKRRLGGLQRSTDVLESKLWAEQRHVADTLRRGHAALAGYRDREARGRELLSKLRLLSVHHDAFFIWHRGPFVTINGCRLGRLPGQVPVEWHEINAALGQAAMLLALVAARVGHVFTRYRVVPMGSFSRLAPGGGAGGASAAGGGSGLSDDKGMHELFYDGSYFGQRRFTAALKALLVCIAELGDYATGVDRSFRLPYAISPGGDKVHELPIAYATGGGGSGSGGAAASKDAVWTRALKLAVTDLKWLLAWAYRQP